MSISDSVYNIFGLVAGIIGILGAIPLCLIYTHLPRRKFRELDCLLEDTQNLLDTAVESGLIHEDRDIRLFARSLLE